MNENYSRDFTRRYLATHGIRPSRPRMAIMHYLLNYTVHPTAEEIYSDLRPNIDTLSKTTVYNTLALFVEHRVANELHLGEQSAHYDAEMAPHGHFICKTCKRIFDLPLTEVRTEDCLSALDGFKVLWTEIYQRGICADCARTSDHD